MFCVIENNIQETRKFDCVARRIKKIVTIPIPMATPGINDSTVALSVRDTSNLLIIMTKKSALVLS